MNQLLKINWYIVAGFIFESEKVVKLDFPGYSGLTTLSYMKTSDPLCHKDFMTTHCLYRQRNASVVQ